MQVVSREFIAGKKVLLRLDLDVPIENGKVDEDFRLKAALPTLRLCLEHASEVIAMGHIGRPKGKKVEELSVAPIYDWLEKQGLSSHLMSGKLKLLENLRFEEGENKCDPEYAKELAGLGEVYINEAFAAHHPAASTTILPTLLPAFAGLHFAREVEKLTKVRQAPRPGLVAIIGGVKAEDKLPAVLALSKIADYVLVGGKIVEELATRGSDANRGPVGLYPRPMSSLDAAGTRRGAPAPATPRDAASLATLNVTEELDKQVTLILQKMSTTGIIVDLQFLKGLSKDWSKKLQDIEQQIYSIIGHQVNLNSPKQLQVVLFDELKLPVVRKTKTGRSTDEDTLRELAPSHPMIPLLLQYRQLFKLVSTYVDALPRFVGSDGRVHSTFNVEGAATGRLSSQNPNLQNIPVKGEMGGEIRKAFVAPIGKILLAADYSQIELRILAHLAQDPGLIKAFNEGLDIHAATASKIFNVPVEKVTKEQRMVGKTMNFATLYGQGAHALARQLGVDYATAQKYIEEYFAQFPKVRVWKAEVLENAKRNGYVETLWGRKRYIPELSAANRQIQAFGERAAINHPVQGTAADMIKKAMVEIDKSLLNIVDRISGEKKTINDKRLTINGLYSMILQVHDELLFECIPDNVGEVGKMVKDKMENALKLSVPVLVDLKVGPNWGEMKALNH